MKLDDHESKYDLFVACATAALSALGASDEPVKGRAIQEWVEKNRAEDFKPI